MRWWRVAAGLLMIGYGVGLGVITITVTADDPDPYAAMQTSGSAPSPRPGHVAPVLRWTAAAAGVGGGAPGYLAAYRRLMLRIDGRTMTVAPNAETETITRQQPRCCGLVGSTAPLHLVGAHPTRSAPRLRRVFPDQPCCIVVPGTIYLARSVHGRGRAASRAGLIVAH